MSDRMTREEFDRRHRERYAKVIRREITVEQAYAEHDADWQAMKGRDDDEPS